MRNSVCYCVFMTQDPGVKKTSLTLVEMLAREVRSQRTKRGWSARELGERCQELGLEWDRNIVANVEHGRRASFTTQELVTLGRVFRMPPIELIFPLGRGDKIEFLPGETNTAWNVSRWFTGEAGFPQVRDEAWEEKYGRGEYFKQSKLYEWYEDPEVGWEDNAIPVILFRRHLQQIHDYYRVPVQVRTMTDPPLIPQLADLPQKDGQALIDRLMKAAAREIQRTRDEMRRHGFKPPHLPEELQYLDESRPGGAI